MSNPTNSPNLSIETLEDRILLAGADTLSLELTESFNEVSVDMQLRTITVNGSDPIEIDSTKSRIFISGDPSQENSFSVVGSELSDRATLKDNRLLMVSEQYRLSIADLDSVIVDAGGGEGEVATFQDTTGDDSVLAGPQSTTLNSSSVVYRINGFDRVNGYARNGGLDSVLVSDSESDDTLVTRTQFIRLTGDNFHLFMGQFEETTTNADAGGNDFARIFDSEGDDLLTIDPLRASISGNGFRHTIENFESTLSNANRGGVDQVTLNDSIGDERFVHQFRYARVNGDGFKHEVRNFEKVFAVSSLGGTDSIRFDDIQANDQFIAKSNEIKMERNGFTTIAFLFDEATVKSDLNGIDRLTIQRRSGELVNEDGTDAIFQGENFNYQFTDFEQIVVEEI